jgi:hypothetical protein
MREKELKKKEKKPNRSPNLAHLSLPFKPRGPKSAQPTYPAGPLTSLSLTLSLTGGAHPPGLPLPPAGRPLPPWPRRPLCPAPPSPPRASSPSLQCSKHPTDTAPSRPRPFLSRKRTPTEPLAINGGRRRARRPPPRPRLLRSPRHL